MCVHAKHYAWTMMCLMYMHNVYSLDSYMLIHAYYKDILILIYIVIGSRISDITRNSDKLHT